MSPARTRSLRALRDLAGALLPLSLRDLESEIEDRLRKIPTQTNEYGYDSCGMHLDSLKRWMVPTALVYRHYFRCDTQGTENVPPGRVLLIANHAGQLPFDGMMLMAAMLLDAEPPRVARGMGEYWIPRLPWVSVTAARTGALVGTPENCAAMLQAGECVMVFPEGVRGINKPFVQRYRLQRFGLGFMRLALETHTPIVPVGIIGSEEQQPGLANLSGVARLLNMPAFPITVGFPWLGPLGILPLPVKYHLRFGEPLHFAGDAGDEDAEIGRKVEVVKAEIDALLARGRAERRGVFR